MGISPINTLEVTKIEISALFYSPGQFSDDIIAKQKINLKSIKAKKCKIFKFSKYHFSIEIYNQKSEYFYILNTSMERARQNLSEYVWVP